MKGAHDVPITKIISRYRKSIYNCIKVSSYVDRLYVYDNSVDGEEAKLQFRLVNGKMGKMYVTDLPEWAQAILPDELI
jgi:predicted ABC-type ATPase